MGGGRRRNVIGGQEGRCAAATISGTDEEWQKKLNYRVGHQRLFLGKKKKVKDS